MILRIFLILSISLAACNNKIPVWDAHFYAGNSRTGSIDRAQSGQSISCEDPRMDQMVCLSYADLKKGYNILLQCKDWGNAQ